MVKGSRGRKAKKPVARKEPQRSKNPRLAESPESLNGRRISWHLGLIDDDGPFGWQTVSRAELFDICRSKFKSFETMTWNEVLGRRHHQLSPDSLSEAAKARLRAINQDDAIEQIVSFALGGKPRVIGIRDRAIFKILWYDPQHQVCPSTLQRT